MDGATAWKDVRKFRVGAGIQAGHHADEGWLVALLGGRDTDAMSRRRALDELDGRGVGGKSTDDYVLIVQDAALHRELNGAISGSSAMAGT